MSRTRRGVLQALLIGLLPLAACNFVESKKQGEAVVEAVFAARKAGDTETALGHYAEAFFREVSRDDWRQVLGKLEDKLGTPGERSLSRVEVHYGDKGAGTGSYTTLVYAVDYSRHPAEETFVLFTPGDARAPVIVGHEINSFGLIGASP